MLGKRFMLLLLLAYADSALAVVADSLTIGNAKALSLGNAVTADPPGIDAIHFNPAGLARINGVCFASSGECVISAAFLFCSDSR